MLSKANITKYSIGLIVLAAVVFFRLTGHAPTKVTNTSNTNNTASATVKAPIPEVTKTDNSAGNAVAPVNKVVSKADVQAFANKSELNNYVLKVIPSFDGGKYPYLLNNDYDNYNGVTENINYQGSLIAKANPDKSKSSHCVGLTYEVFFKAMQERNKEAGLPPDNFNNMNINNMRDFMLTWYDADGTPKSEGTSWQEQS